MLCTANAILQRKLSYCINGLDIENDFCCLNWEQWSRAAIKTCRVDASGDSCQKYVQAKTLLTFLVSCLDTKLIDSRDRLAVVMALNSYSSFHIRTLPCYGLYNSLYIDCPNTWNLGILSRCFKHHVCHRPNRTFKTSWTLNWDNFYQTNCHTQCSDIPDQQGSPGKNWNELALNPRLFCFEHLGILSNRASWAAFVAHWTGRTYAL